MCVKIACLYSVKLADNHQEYREKFDACSCFYLIRTSEIHERQTESAESCCFYSLILKPMRFLRGCEKTVLARYHDI